jgi:hypothetical protein
MAATITRERPVHQGSGEHCCQHPGMTGKSRSDPQGSPRWRRADSNGQPRAYESPALPLSYVAVREAAPDRFRSAAPVTRAPIPPGSSRTSVQSPPQSATIPGRRGAGIVPSNRRILPGLPGKSSAHAFGSVLLLQEGLPGTVCTRGGHPSTRSAWLSPPKAQRAEFADASGPFGCNGRRLAGLAIHQEEREDHPASPGALRSFG